jgi:hypothetical protein
MRTIESLRADLDMWKARYRDSEDHVRCLLAECEIVLNTADGV